MSVTVLHLLGTAQPEGAGIARIVAGLASALDPARYRVHAWFLGPPGPLMEDLREAGATVRSIGWWRGARDPAGACHFWRCLRMQDFAIVHQHFGARSVRRIIRLASDARLVVHLHGLTGAQPHFATAGADLVIAASHAIARGMPGAKPVVVHAGVAVPARSATGDFTSRSSVVIGAACRFVPGKGLLELIRATALLVPEFPTLRLEIAGNGPQRAELEQEVARLRPSTVNTNAENQNWVRFFEWQPNIAPLLRSWDIFAMPSHEEGFGMAALEAMAEGLPVVATRVGGLPEIVAHGETGYLVPPGDVGALAASLRILMAGPERRTAMGAAGQERARSRFAAARMVAETAAIYDSLVQSSGTATMMVYPRR